MDTNNELIYSQTNFRFSSTKFKNRTYRTAKLFNSHPLMPNTSSLTDLRQGFNFRLTTTKYIFPKLKKKMKPAKFDPEFLKNDLITQRSEIHKRKNELHLLKIKYNKLLMDNIYNKTLLAKILEIPLNKSVSRDMVFTKIKNCKLTPENRITLKNAHEILTLKLDIEDKKKLLTQKNIYLNNLEKNSKSKIVSNLQNDYFIKCEQQRSLLNTLEKLEKRYSKYEKKLEEENEKLKIENYTNEKLIDKEVEGVEQIQKMIDEKCNLIKQINQLADKIKKMDKSNSDKEKEIKEEERANIYEEKNLKLINKYKSVISEDQREIQHKKKLKEESDSYLKEIEKEMKSLQEQLESLNSKMYKYRDEKPKLLRKANESKKDIEKMESLKKELEETKKTKEKTEQEHKQKQKELQEINNKDNLDNEEYNKQIDQNNNEKEDLNKKIEELSQKLNEVTDKNNKIFYQVNNGQSELNKLEQNIESLKKQIEQSNLENEENQQKVDEEKKKELNKVIKERKREIDRLKKEQNKFSNDNRMLKEQNKIIQDELDGYNISLENFEQIQNDLNDAIAKLNNLKK